MHEHKTIISHKKQRELLIKQNKQQSNEGTMKFTDLGYEVFTAVKIYFVVLWHYCSEDGNGMFFQNMLTAWEMTWYQFQQTTIVIVSRLLVNNHVYYNINISIQKLSSITYRSVCLLCTVLMPQEEVPLIVEWQHLKLTPFCLPLYSPSTSETVSCSPNYVLLVTVTMWLPLPIFISTEWLDYWVSLGRYSTR